MTTVIDGTTGTSIAGASSTAGNFSVGGALAVTGNTTLTGTLSVGGILFAPAAISQVVVNSTTTSTATTNTTLAGVTTTLTGSITPSSATNKILVQVNVGWIFSNQSSAAGYATFSLYRGATQIITPWFRGPYLPGVNTSIYGSASASYLDSPNSTSAVTYTLFFNTTGATQTQTVQVQNTPSYITLYEINA